MSQNHRTNWTQEVKQRSIGKAWELSFVRLQPLSVKEMLKLSEYDFRWYCFFMNIEEQNRPDREDSKTAA